MNCGAPSLASENTASRAVLARCLFSRGVTGAQMTIKPQFCKSCGWSESDLRRRVLGNGAVQLVYQCLNCGRSAGNPIAHSSVPNAHKLSSWDDRIAENYDERRAGDRLGEREQWFAEHDAYLKTPEWREKRRLVMQRCAGLCEGCRSAPAEHVHHLSYDHWKNELLWELVGVCESCHHRAHKVVKFVGVSAQ